MWLVTTLANSQADLREISNGRRGQSYISSWNSVLRQEAILSPIVAPICLTSSVSTCTDTCSISLPPENAGRSADPPAFSRKSTTIFRHSRPGSMMRGGSQRLPLNTYISSPWATPKSMSPAYRRKIEFINFKCSPQIVPNSKWRCRGEVSLKQIVNTKTSHCSGLRWQNKTHKKNNNNKR